MSSTQVSISLMRLKLLDALRSGDAKRIDKIVEDLSVEVTVQNSEILGLRETILHYAVQVAPLTTIKYIVESGKFPFVDINSQDKEGNTPLHLAAASSRLEVVRYLLSLPNINDTIINGNKEQPVEMCKDLNIVQVMQFERAKFVEALSAKLKGYFMNREFDNLEKLLVGNPRAAELLDINGAEPDTGNTVLHEFIDKNDLEMCQWILKHGGDPFRRDKKGCLPSDLVDPKNEPLRKLLQSASKEQTMMDPVQNSQNSGKAGVIPTYKGYLRKWTNFAGGYKLRYFVLDSNGILSYYTDQDDTSNACRGSINLGYATLHLDSSEKLKFEIIGKNGIRLHLKANHATETNRWVWNLQNAITISKDNIKRRVRGSIVDEVGETPATTNAAASGDVPTTNATGSSGNSSPPSYTVTELSSIEESKPYVPSNLGNPDANDAEPKRRLSLESKTKKLLRIPRRMKRKSHKRVSSMGSVGSFEEDSAPPSRSSSLTRISFENKSTTSLTDSIKFRNIDDVDDLENFDYDVDEDEDSGSEGDIYSKRSGITDSVSGVTTDESELAFTIKRSIDMEISGFVDLITKLSLVKKDDPEDSEFCEVGLNTMNTISDLLSRYNKLVSTRERRTLVKLERQLEINKLWEQSIRQLESEFQKREEKLASYEGQRKQLKKIIKSGSLSKVPQLPVQDDAESTETSEATRRASIASIAGGDAALEEELEEILEDSEDEFFDADELIDEDEEAIKADENENVPVRSPVVAEKPDLETVHEVPKEKAVDGTPEIAIDEKTIEEDSTISKEENITKEHEARGFITTANNGLKVINEPQLKKKLLIEKEQSYKGYENPPRTKLSLDEDDRPKVSLWGVVKSMIGKDMTRMALPVSFNEPTSLLQRLVEDVEYSTLLDTAAGYDDSTLRMIYVSAFAASEYASTIDRIAKPFNPLLGETFEYCRPDKNYRLITEQVSHHPPISACHVESIKWDYYGENAVDSKFRGRLFDFKHLGKMFCVIRPDNGVIDVNGNKVTEELYSWKKVNTSVVGIMIGNPTVDNYGAMHVTNHTTGDVMVVDLKQRGWRASSAYQLSGQSCDATGKAHWAMAGHWNSKIFAKYIKDMNAGEPNSIINEGGHSTDPYSGNKFLVWQAAPRPKVPFNLTAFATTLNGIDDNLKPWLPPTDTRLRPDQRAMEDGQYTFAADEKHRVEVKQRNARKEREISKKPYRPNWFVKRRHPVTGDSFWEFSHTYWPRRAEHDLEGCGDIF